MSAPTPDAFEFHRKEVVETVSVFGGIESPYWRLIYMLARDVILDPCRAICDDHFPIRLSVVVSPFHGILLPV
jgi:hypothetical protein